MNRFFIFPFLIILLTACVSSAAQQDLYSNAQSSRATADAAIRQAQFQEQFLTATAQAPIVHITETAAGLIVQAINAESTSVAGASTQEASYTQTAIYWTPTANATQTRAFVQLEAEKQIFANNVARDQLELQRQADNNDFIAKLPAYSFAVLVLVLVIVLVFISRREQYKPAQVDARGNLLPMLNVVDGTYTDIDGNPNYRGDLRDSLFKQWLRKKLDLPPLLPAVTPARQDVVKERDQMIDLATRGLPGGESSADVRDRKKMATQQVLKQLSDSNMTSRYKLLDSDPGNLGVINDQVVQVLDAEWKESKK